MNLLFVADPLASFKIYKDSTYAMMREADQRGHALWACTPADLSWSGGRVWAVTRPVTLLSLDREAEHRPGAEWFRQGEETLRPLLEFGAVLMRKDPPFDQEYWPSPASRSSPYPPWSPAGRRRSVPSSLSRVTSSSSRSTPWAGHRSFACDRATPTSASPSRS